MKNIDNNKKTDILLAALEERYASIHKIRDRVQTTGILILGILSSVSGWLIQSKVALSCMEKQLFIVGAVIILILLRFVYFKDLNKGFKSQQRTAAKLEETLGFYESKYFTDNEDHMYPEKWKNAGTETGEGKFFQSTYYLIYAGFAFLLIAILLAPIKIDFPISIFLH